MSVRSGSGKAYACIDWAGALPRLSRLFFVAVLSGFSATTAGAQATSQRHIPIKKEARHVDTVWIHDTVTITLAKVDTLRLGESPPSLASFFRVDTLVRVDTTKNCRDIFLPVPIPFNHGANNPGSSFVTANPEPATIVLVGIGLVGVGLIARKKRPKKDPP